MVTEDIRVIKPGDIANPIGFAGGLAKAARYCDRIALLRQGHLWALGPPIEVLTPDNLRSVFEVEVEIVSTSFGQQIFPIAASSKESIQS